MTQGIFMRSTFKGCLVICILLPHRRRFKKKIRYFHKNWARFWAINRLKQLQFTPYDLPLHPICVCKKNDMVDENKPV